MVYPELQVRQIYAIDSTHGAVAHSTKNGKQLYFKITDASKTEITSDRIPYDNIRSITVSKPKGTITKKWTIKLPDLVGVDVTTPVVRSGEDYLLRINFTDFMGVGPDHFYYQYGVVHGTATMTPSKFYKTLKDSLDANFKRSAYKPFTFKLEGSGPSNYTGVIIEENTPYWEPGRFQQETVHCTISADTISEYENTGNSSAPVWKKTDNQVVWGGADKTGIFTPVTNKDLGNAANLSDLEWYGLKQRADIYGYMGYPDINPSKQILTEGSVETLQGSSTYLYCLDIWYYFIDHGVNNEKSERNITFIGTKSDIENLLKIGGKGAAWATEDVAYKNSAIDEVVYKVTLPKLATVATTGSYNDLKDKPVAAKV